MRMLLVSTMIALCAFMHPAWALETQDGDPCTSGEEGHARRTGGPENNGVSELLICNGSQWVMAERWALPSPCSGGGVGHVCSDGSIFAGDANMYVTDANQSTSIQWSSENVVTGADSPTDGAANQAWIVANETLSQYPAFELCENLNRHGHTDWYLPSRNELNLLYTNKDAIGGFIPGVYWSSTGYTSGLAWYQHFMDGSFEGGNKGSGLTIRCVRRG